MPTRHLHQQAGRNGQYHGTSRDAQTGYRLAKSHSHKHHADDELKHGAPPTQPHGELIHVGSQRELEEDDHHAKSDGRDSHRLQSPHPRRWERAHRLEILGDGPAQVLR